MPSGWPSSPVAGRARIIGVSCSMISAVVTPTASTSFVSMVAMLVLSLPSPASEPSKGRRRARGVPAARESVVGCRSNTSRAEQHALLVGCLKTTLSPLTRLCQTDVDWWPSRSSYSRKRPKEDTVQYALLIYGSDEAWGQLSKEEREAQSQEYMTLAQQPETRGGADLGDLSSATTVRVNGSDALTTDGPFAETKEYLGGFYLV